MVSRIGALSGGAAAGGLTREEADATYVTVVDAGTNLATVRPAGAVVVLWSFDAGVSVGSGGASIVNRQPGDLYFVADA